MKQLIKINNIYQLKRVKSYNDVFRYMDKSLELLTFDSGNLKIVICDASAKNR